MNAEISITQRAILDLFQKKKDYLAGKPLHFVEDLLHEAESLTHSTTFSVRVSAEINRTACEVFLEAQQATYSHG